MTTAHTRPSNLTTQPIHAPLEVVWRLLTDLDSYERWNRFTPRIQGELRVGARLVLWARVGPFLMPNLERIEVLDEGRELTWGTTWPLGLLRGRRWQRLHPTPDGCRYETEERFEGLLAPLVALFAGSLVRRGFESMAAGLARQAEGVAA